MITVMEFGKKLLIADYVVLLGLVIVQLIFSEIDLSAIIIAWIAQVGISSGMYYWKARHENRMKIPINVIKSLPKNMRSEIDLTQIIVAIVQSE